MARDESAIPNDMRKVYRRFQWWRSSHTGHLPIPESGWAAEVDSDNALLSPSRGAPR
jgi:hypothetical protein